MSFFDRTGLLHHVKNPTLISSENSPLFTATNLSLVSFKRGFALVWATSRKAIEEFRVGDKFKFNNYSHQANMPVKPLSHDNQEGIYALHYLAREPIPKRFNRRAHLRPDNFAQWLWFIVDSRAKFSSKWWLLLKPLTFPLFLFWFLASSYSMTRRYKVRKGEKFRVTDGKLILLTNCLSCQLFGTLRWFTFILVHINPEFDDWYDVAITYYEDPEHPIPQLVKELYDKLHQIPFMPKAKRGD